MPVVAARRRCGKLLPGSRQAPVKQEEVRME